MIDAEERRGLLDIEVIFVSILACLLNCVHTHPHPNTDNEDTKGQVGRVGGMCPIWSGYI